MTISEEIQSNLLDFLLRVSIVNLTCLVRLFGKSSTCTGDWEHMSDWLALRFALLLELVRQ
jgi:hypothetical protein